MSGNLTDKFISNTYTKIFQKSELSDSEGNESINLDSGLNNDSFTLVNGLGQKIRSFILDVGNPAGATMGYGIYFQTDSMKSSGDFGLRFSSINERGQITSQNKDILISSDNSTSGDSLEDRRRLILKGGIPGTMSFSNTDEGIVGGPVGTQSQITLLLQGRVSTEHYYPIVLNDFQNQELGLMSGVFNGEGPEEIQIWNKVGNVVNVCGSWRWDPSGIGSGPSVVSMYLIEQNFTNYIFPVFISGSIPISYDASTGIFTINSSGTYTISGKIWVRYKRIGAGGAFVDIFDSTNSTTLRPNIIINKNTTTIFQQTYLSPPPTTPVPSNSVGQISEWFELSFSKVEPFIVNDTFELKYFIDTSYNIFSYWYILTQQFEVEFGNGSYVEVDGVEVAGMGNGNISVNPYSTDLRFPIINGKNINRVWGNAKFRNELLNNYGYIKENIDSNNRLISASFYQGSSLSTQSLGPVDFSYSYILEF